MIAVSTRAGQIFVLLILNFSSLSPGLKQEAFLGRTGKWRGLSECGGMGSFDATKALEADDVQSTSSRFGRVTVSTTIPGVARLANWRENLLPYVFQGCISFVFCR